MAMVRKRLILTGPLAGRSVTLRSFEFVGGAITVTGQPDKVDNIAKYLAMNWQAFPEGSAELEAAQKRDMQHAEEQAVKEEGDGQRDLQGSNRENEGSDEADGDVQSAGQGSSEEDAEDGEGDADSEAGSEGSVPSGDGHEDSGLPDEQEESGETEDSDSGNEEPEAEIDNRLKAVIMALDPEVDDHWTEGGKPAISAVAEGYGSTGLTRADINAAAPDWNREQAQLKDLSG